MTSNKSEGVRAGLEDVLVADSSICKIDGEAGRLIYRGYDVTDLAANCCFEETAHLLWHGRLPNSVELREISVAIGAHHGLTLPMLELLASFPHNAAPMSVLRTAISALGLHDPRAESNVEETNIELAYQITAQTASIVAGYHRFRTGQDPLVPDPGMSHAANFLFCLTGEYPDDITAHVFDDCLTLHAEHGFNASTFAARVTAATLSDMYSAVTSAIGTLRGPLHGGANQRVMGMLQEIGSPEHARPWVLEQLAVKKRIMGFGHRVYTTEDPRATVLREWCQRLGEHSGQSQWYDISRAVEETLLAEKGLHPNVDFYSAPVYHMLHIDNDLYTCVFTMARMVGWTAHVLEQWADNRLIRPRCRYCGQTDLKVPSVAER